MSREEGRDNFTAADRDAIYVQLTKVQVVPSEPHLPEVEFRSLAVFLAGKILTLETKDEQHIVDKSFPSR